MKASIGDIEITCIEELVVPEATTLFAQWNDDVLAQHRDLLVPHCFDPAQNAFLASIRSYLVKTPNRTILVDTGAGNNKPRPGSMRFDNLDTDYIARLATTGVSPDQVDMVICTHLHVDHVGWNTRLVNDRWVPTFRNATYVFPRIEVDWRDPVLGAADRPPATQLPFKDSVKPIIDSGMARLVEGDEQLIEGVDLMPVPGHAPGQMAVRLRSQGKEALMIADVMHQPIQVHYPSWNSKYCEDPVIATQTRRRVLDHCADHGSLMLPTHFNFPLGGYVTRSPGGFTFTPHM